MDMDTQAPERDEAITQRRGRRGRIAAVVILLAVGGVGIPLALRGGGLPKRFAEVDKGVLLRSGQPTPRQLDNLIDRHGVKTIVIARSDKSEKVLEETTNAESRGIKVVSVSIVSRANITDEQVAQFFSTVDDPANRPVLVHCSAGRHRTGYLCALYRIERQGWSKERAIEEMLSFGFDQKDQAIVLEQLQAYVPIRERAHPTP
jgi:tyrosine-protein phosphatase SIW14